MNTPIAQTGTNLGDPFTGIGKGPLSTGQNALSTFTNFISSAIGIMTVIAIIWFTFAFITGAISMIGAGGDKQAMETARKRITSAIVGLVVVIAAIFIIDLIGYLLNIPNILNIPDLIDSIIGGS